MSFYIPELLSAAYLGRFFAIECGNPINHIVNASRVAMTHRNIHTKGALNIEISPLLSSATSYRFQKR